MNTVVEKKTTVKVVTPSVRKVEVSTPGPQGTPGASGVSYLFYTAHTPLSGHRVVAAFFNDSAVYADSNTVSLAPMVLGITTGAAAQGALAQILPSGPITEPSWSWVAGLPIFVGPNGILTQTPPATGFSMVVATPVSPTGIVVNLSPPIIL